MDKIELPAGQRVVMPTTPTMTKIEARALRAFQVEMRFQGLTLELSRRIAFREYFLRHSFKDRLPRGRFFSSALGTHMNSRHCA